MNDFLPKPFTQEQLAQMLARWLPEADPTRHEPPVATPAAPADHVIQDSLINLKQIDFIRQLDATGEGGLLRDMLNHFLVSIEEAWVGIEGAVQANDFKSVTQIAHKQKSGASNVGADQLAGLYRQLEGFARDGRMTDIQAQLPRLRQLQKQTVMGIQAILKEAVK